MKKIKVPFDERAMQRYLDAEPPESMDALLKELIETYEYDYGSICQMIGLYAVLAARKADQSEAGGITGFQANGVMWEFIQKWMHIKGAMRLVNYNDMLYPQYEEEFQKFISCDTANWLKETAQKKLDEIKTADYDVSETVIEHWMSIAAGMIPFGYKVKE